MPPAYYFISQNSFMPLHCLRLNKTSHVKLILALWGHVPGIPSLLNVIDMFSHFSQVHLGRRNHQIEVQGEGKTWDAYLLTYYFNTHVLSFLGKFSLEKGKS